LSEYNPKLDYGTKLESLHSLLIHYINIVFQYRTILHWPYL